MAGRGFHLSAILAVLVVTASLLLANFYGFKTDELPDGSQFLTYGWPTTYLTRSATSFDETKLGLVDTTRWAFVPVNEPNDIVWWIPRSIWINSIAAVAVLACTCHVVFTRRRSPFSLWQITLRELLMFTTMACAFLALARIGKYWPLVTWKPLLFFPILFGVYCVASVLPSLLTATFRAIPTCRAGKNVYNQPKG